MSLRPTLRLAARDARRAKARSILVVAMIGLPVLALAYADVMWRTSVPSTQESLTQRLGTSAAMLETMGGSGQTVVQAADPKSGWGSNGDGSMPSNPGETLAGLTLPASSRLVLEQQSSVGVHTRTGIGSVGWTEVDLDDPVLEGRWTLLEGRAAASADEVVVTAPLLDRTGLEVGGTLELTDPVRSYTIVGVAELSSYRASETVVAAPGTLIGSEGGILADQVYTSAGFLDGPPVSWDQVLEFNEQGVLVTSRAVILDPPATTPYDAQFGGYGSSVTDLLVPVLIASVVVGLALLEVILLAGAAFAVGARRQAHSLALVAASGGSRRDLRRVVLGGGVVLGLVAGVVGVTLGIVAAFATRLALLAWTTLDVAAFDVRPLELLVVVAVGVVTGILAAVVPARQAARMDVVAALRGQRGSPAPSRRTPIVGVAMVLVGVVLSILGSGWAVAAQRSETLSVRRELIALPIVLGAALVVLGLVVCSPTVVSVAARIAPRLSLAGRLALRDADRNRGRSAPAVAAVLAAVSGSVAVMLYVASLDQHDRETYWPALPANTAQLPLQYWTESDSRNGGAASQLDPDAAASVLERTLPVGTTTVVRALEDCFGPDCTQVVLLRPAGQSCPINYDDARLTQEQLDAGQDDVRCTPDGSASRYYALAGGHDTVVGGPDLLAAAGLPVSDAMTSVLEGGGVVLTDPLMLNADGTVTIGVFKGTETKLYSNGQQVPKGLKPIKVLSVPAVLVPAADSFAPIVLSPKAAAEAGAPVYEASLLASLTETATTDQVDAARAAVVADLPLDEYALTVERGYQSTYGLGLLALAIAAGIVTLGATGIATGLALTDARADHATLAAVGAAPGLRRRLAGAQALVIGTLGVLLGVAAGVVPAISLIGSIDSLSVVWPWPQLLALVVGIPLLAGGAAFLFTRSKVPMQRRVVA